MSATTDHPRVFISYSWTSAEHQQFVEDLAITLRSKGVDAILDIWDLQPGNDKFSFMESMVVDPTVGRVLVISDKGYQRKANERLGGVGTESQIISTEVYGKVRQSKFIPIVREYGDDGEPCLPVFMKGLLYIDMSSEEKYGDALDQLLRNIYEVPRHQKPQLGARPTFDDPAAAPRHVIPPQAAPLLIATEPLGKAAEAQFLRRLLSDLDAAYVQPHEEVDEEIYQAIVRTKPLRDQFSNYVEAVALSSNDDPVSLAPVLRLLSDIGVKFGPPVISGGFLDEWADFYRFFAYEAVLVQTAALLRNHRWKSLNRLVSAKYLIRELHHPEEALPLWAFDQHIRTLDTLRNQRLNLNRISITVDLLRERSSEGSTTFAELMQADVFLTLASFVQFSTNSADKGYNLWWAPRTNIFAGHGNRHRLFLMAADFEVRRGLQDATGAKSGSAIEAALVAAAARLGGSFKRLSTDTFGRFSFDQAINRQELIK